MKKATKAIMLSQLEKQLAELDDMITRNAHNENAVKSFQEQYNRLAKIMSEIRDSETTD
jgi:hypothetical protein